MTIKVGIIDDHQSIIDGYTFRLEKDPDIKVVGTGNYGDEVEKILKSTEIDILLLDISVPSSEQNSNPYPILHIIPEALDTYKELSIIVISMHNRKTLINSILDAGASGFILKDDRQSLVNLANVVKAVYNDGVYFSKQTYALLKKTGLDDEIPEFSLRQKEILALSAANPSWTLKRISNELGLAPSTIRNTMSRLYLDIGVANLRSAVEFARANHLITPFE